MTRKLMRVTHKEGGRTSQPCFGIGSIFQQWWGTIIYQPIKEYQANKKQPADANPQAKLSVVLVHDLLDEFRCVVSEDVVVSKGLSKMCLELVFALTTFCRGRATLCRNIRLRCAWGFFGSRGITGSGLMDNPHTNLLMAGACTPIVSLTVLCKSCLGSFAMLELPSSVLGHQFGDSVLGILSTGLRLLVSI